MIGLQTMLPSLLSQDIDLELLISKITEAPRRILKQDVVKIEDGAVANICIFDPKDQWVLDDDSNFSKSSNSPFFGKSIKGKVKAVFNNGQGIGEII